MKVVDVEVVLPRVLQDGEALTALPTEADGGLGKSAVAACTVLAGMATAIYKALGLDVSLDLIAKQANQFKILRDRFRQALAGFGAPR